jgi:hypothetical protein
MRAVLRVVGIINAIFFRHIAIYLFIYLAYNATDLYNTVNGNESLSLPPYSPEVIPSMRILRIIVSFSS